jgi:hypothetical protein
MSRKDDQCYQYWGHILPTSLCFVTRGYRQVHVSTRIPLFAKCWDQGAQFYILCCHQAKHSSRNYKIESRSHMPSQPRELMASNLYGPLPTRCIATGYGLDGRGVEVRVPVGSRIFSTSSIPALGSTQPPIQWAPGALSPGVKLTTHLQPVPRSRKCGSIHPLPHTPSWRSA